MGLDDRCENVLHSHSICGFIPYHSTKRLKRLVRLSFTKKSRMASNESTCLNKGTFSDDDVTHGNTNDKTEITNTGFLETDEGTEEKSK